MGRLFKAFIFKIRRDATFKITLIVGAGIAVFITLLYLILQNALPDEFGDAKLLTGPTMLLNSFSPVQNFGIAIPVNLISFTCLEFTQGTIRNKIIAGNSKFKIYASLCLSGLVFAFALIIVYAAICTGLGSIFGGFDLSKPVALMTGKPGYIDGVLILKYLLIVVVAYISIVSFAIFIATSFRNIGPCIPIVMIVLMVCYLSTTIIISLPDMIDVGAVKGVLKIINPLYALSGGVESNDAQKMFIANDTLIAAVINNLVYAGLFFTAGSLLFKKRDVK